MGLLGERFYAGLAWFSLAFAASHAVTGDFPTAAFNAIVAIGLAWQADSVAGTGAPRR